MKKFKIYGFSNDNPIIITDSENLTAAATFEETMSLQEHMKSSLSFKISDTLDNGQTNPFMGLVYPGAKIRLKLKDNETYITYDFIINNLSPEFYKDLIIYSVSCEDYASFIYSKQGQGLTYINSFTGTLKEQIYEVLVATRKNIGYRGLNKNYLKFSSYSELSNATVKDYSVTFAASSTGYIIFPVDKEIAATEYSFFVNLLSVPTTSSTLTLSQLDGNGTLISTSSALVKSVIGLAQIDFILNAGAAYIKLQVINAGTGTSTLTDFKLNLKITSAIQTIINQSLKLDDSFDEEEFKGELGDTSYYKKVTTTFSNTNLYNALFELAKLFDAEILFDYENNSFNFRSKEVYYQYKGFRLSPDFNLLSLSRTEDASEFNTVMNVIGNDSVNSIFPPMPSEFKIYLQKCITNNFTGTEYFETYTTDGYQTLASTYIIPDVENPVTDPDRIKAIENFAIAADKVPNLENALYSLDYYEKTSKITTALVTTFKNIIKDDLRKINIQLKLALEKYLNIQYLLSSKESLIDFNSQNITVEEKSIAAVEDEMTTLGITEGDENWASYINSINSSREAIFEYKQQLLDLYGLVYNVNDNYVVTTMANDGAPETTTFTSVGHDFVVGDQVSLIQANNELIPAVFSFKDFYYIVESNTDTFKISLTKGGTAITVATEDLTKTSGWYFIRDFTINGLDTELYSGEYRLKKDSYTWLILNYQGYYNIYNNGVKERIREIQNTINELANTKAENIARIAELDAYINTINNEQDPRSIEAQVERDGKQAQVDASEFNIGVYTSDVWNPTIKGKYHYQYDYLNTIAYYLDSYTYRATLIDYSEWVVDTPTVGDWDYTGTVTTELQANKDLTNDLMMKLTTTGTVKVNAIQLDAGGVYRSSGLFKIPATSNGTLTVSLYKNGVATGAAMSWSLASVGSDRWVGFDFRPTGTGSAAYFMPSNTSITLDSSTTTTLVSSASDYQLYYTWSGTGSVYLYRPRMELVSSISHTIEEIYYLYDNPLMVNYNPSLAINISYIEGLYDLIANRAYSGNLYNAKDIIVNNLYINYEPYIIEGYYENSDEIDSEGLMEQALINFELTKYPKIDYGISVIDLSSLEDYQYLTIHVGDKILITDPYNRLYKSYQPEATKYLSIREIGYNLRQPESTSLTIAQDDETKKILQYILKGTF